MSTSKKIRIAMINKNISLNELAEKVETSSQNLNNKFRRDNLSENDIKKYLNNCGKERKIIWTQDLEMIIVLEAN